MKSLVRVSWFKWNNQKSAAIQSDLAFSVSFKEFQREKSAHCISIERCTMKLFVFGSFWLKRC